MNNAQDYVRRKRRVEMLTRLLVNGLNSLEEDAACLEPAAAQSHMCQLLVNIEEQLIPVACWLCMCHSGVIEDELDKLEEGEGHE